MQKKEAEADLMFQKALKENSFSDIKNFGIKSKLELAVKVYNEIKENLVRLDIDVTFFEAVAITSPHGSEERMKAIGKIPQDKDQAIKEAKILEAMLAVIRKYAKDEKAVK